LEVCRRPTLPSIRHTTTNETGKRRCTPFRWKATGRPAPRDKTNLYKGTARPDKIRAIYHLQCKHNKMSD